MSNGTRLSEMLEKFSNALQEILYESDQDSEEEMEEEPEDDEDSTLIKAPLGKWVIVRTCASGVHFGVLKKYDFSTRHAVLDSSRRIWGWKGAFTLSAVAREGIGEGSKLSTTLDNHLVTQVEEIIRCVPKVVKMLREWITHVPVPDPE